MTKPTDPLAEFRADLRSRLREASPDVRKETLRDIDEHVAAEIAALGLDGEDPSPDQLRSIVATLGTPESVAAQALGYSPALGPGSRRSLAGGGVIAIVLILQVVGIGGTFLVIPIVAAIAAVVLCCLSPLYETWEKVANSLATLGAIVGVAMVFDVALQGMDGCHDPAKETSNPDALPLCSDLYSTGNKVLETGGAALLVAGITVAIVLAVRVALRRQRTMQGGR